MNGLTKITISQITHNTPKNHFLTCIVVAKSKINVFNKIMFKSAKDENDSKKRAVVTITVRDSPKSIINCVIWGSEDFCLEYGAKINVGNVVNIISPKITPASNENGYKPQTTSDHALCINEGQNEITLHHGENEQFYELMRIPVKSTLSVLKLQDIISKGNQSNGDFIDLLVMVRNIKPIKNYSNRKSFSDLKFREIICFDQSNSGTCIKIWNCGYLERSNKWKERQTVLHITDAKAEYSSYYKSVTVSTHSRTIIIEDPNTTESHSLRQYARFAQFDDSDLKVFSPGLPKAEDIKTIMTARQIIDCAESNTDVGLPDQFTALIYGVITKFNIDGCDTIIFRKCTSCKGAMTLQEEYCPLPGCLSKLTEYNENHSYEDCYAVFINISDHTGTVSGIWLDTNIIEKMLKYAPGDFARLDPTKKAEIKWSWLFVRCAVKLVIRRKNDFHSKMSVTLVECTIANPHDILRDINIY